MNRRTSLHWNRGNLSEWETVPISRAFQEEVQAVRTGGGTAAGSRVQDGEGNI